MNIAYLLIGGNEGDRMGRLAEARDQIGEVTGKILRASSVYETAPWGKTDQPDFLNQALEVETALDASALMAALLDIEKKMGRIRNEKYGQRLIDIDLLFYNNEVIRLPLLTVPHPEMAKRRFVLAPLNEIAPLFRHPVLQRTVHDLLAACPDSLDVRKIS
jgi:2-amino-4-hydroxy-6-hydroxymethyldihydropteridine diphosphokinase